MKSLKTKQLLWLAGAAASLFILNNIMLGFIIPRLPGGSSTGISSMFVLTLISLYFKRFGNIPIIYLFYGLFGLISHLLAGDSMYLLAILFLVLSALVYDLLLYFGKYHVLANLYALPVFIVIENIAMQVLGYIGSGHWNFPKMDGFLMNLVYGFAGIGIAFIVHRIFERKKKIKLAGNI